HTELQLKLGAASLNALLDQIAKEDGAPPSATQVAEVKAIAGSMEPARSVKLLKSLFSVTPGAEKRYLHCGECHSERMLFTAAYHLTALRASHNEDAEGVLEAIVPSIFKAARHEAPI